MVILSLQVGLAKEAEREIFDDEEYISYISGSTTIKFTIYEDDLEASEWDGDLSRLRVSMADAIHIAKKFLVGFGYKLENLELAGVSLQELSTGWWIWEVILIDGQQTASSPIRLKIPVLLSGKVPPHSKLEAPTPSPPTAVKE